LTGVVLAICALVAVEVGGLAFLAAVTALTAIVTFEWIRMSCRDGSHGTLTLSVVAPLAGATALAIWDAEMALIFGAIGAVLIGLAAKIEKNNSILVAAGTAVFVLSLISTNWLRVENGTGLATIYWLFAVVWATDSGAYLIGSFVGGARFAPRISPGKTWAGAIGGLAIGILAGIALTFVLSGVGVLEAIPNLAIIAVASALLSVLAQAGDLAESSMKRYFGVKDSGAWLPGHGGALDRLDSLIFVTPLLALAVLLAGGSGRLLWAGGW
jgi:phosphatidate cytidylyltransferase